MSKVYNIDFNDSISDLKGWKNPRYEGSKLKAAQINKFTPGDKSFGKLPVIQRKTNAIYIANTIRDAYAVADPDPNNKYARIKNHSYIGIEKLLLVNDNDDSITIIDGKGVGEDIVGNVNFLGFNRFLTSDFPTGGKFRIKVLDESISTNLKPEGYFVKMNKGYLYPAFRYNLVQDSENYDERNGMYFYTNGTNTDFLHVTGSTPGQDDVFAPTDTIRSGSLRFRYANFWGQSTTNFGMNNSTPSFASSSFISNPFTTQYYSGSFGIINNNENDGVSNASKYAKSGLGSASRFLGIDTLNFLKTTTTDPSIPIQDKTELHITFFEGTKDFAPGKNDERSISTFEIDSNQDALQLGDELCNAGLPTVHEFILKGENDHRFNPSISYHLDDIQTSYFIANQFDDVTLQDTEGCHVLPVIERMEEIGVFVQGGNEGPDGLQSQQQLSVALVAEFPEAIGGGLVYPTEADLPFNSRADDAAFTEVNSYSGSFNYEISFLRKDHVLIADLEKPFELPEGIGTKGVVLIPENLDKGILKNLDYYLQQAGLIDTTISKDPNTQKKGFK